MKPLSKIRSLVTAVLRRRQMENDMTHELQFHIEARADDLASRGLSREEALRQARIEFGGIEKYKEEGRQARGVRLFDEIRGDLRYAVRQLGKTRAFMVAAVLTLALGIAANTAVFTLVNALTLKTLPVPKPEQLRQLEWTSPRPEFVGNYNGYTWHDSTRKASFSYPVYKYIRDHSSTFSGLICFGNFESSNLGIGDHAQEATAVRVSGNYFQALGVDAALGRTITPDDDRVGISPGPIVLTYSFWERVFAKDPLVLGKSLTVNGSPSVIIGVLPKGFQGLHLWLITADFFLPLAADSSTTIASRRLNDARNYNLMVFGRLREGITEDLTRTETEILMRRFIAADPPAMPYEPPRIGLVAGAQGTDNFRHGFSAPLLIMMSVVGMILAIVCANLSGLFFARAEARRREVGTRLALGAPRARLVRQFLTESLLLSSLGAAVGIPLAYALVDALPGALPSSVLRIGLDLSPDYRVLFFSIVLSALTAALFGLAPALHATRVDLLAMIKPVTGSPMRMRFQSRKVLVAAQISISLLLLVGTGLLARTLTNMRSVSLGFDPANILTFQMDPMLNGYTGGRLLTYFERVAAAIESVQGVRSVSFSSNGILTGTSATMNVCMPGRNIENVHVHYTSPRFLETFGIPIVLGRSFGLEDRQNSRRIVLVNETFAKQFLPGTDALGRAVGVDCGVRPASAEVIGVVADTKYDSLREASPPTMYIPYWQRPFRFAAFEVRTTVEPKTLVPVIRRTLAGIDPSVPMFEVVTQTEYLDMYMLPERLFAGLVGFFGFLGLLLACLGIYGTVAYTVSRRIPEIGIRMALGASRSEVIRMVLAESFATVALGLCFGLIATFILTRFLENILFGVSAIDPLSILAAIILLSVSAAVAAVIPARRASDINPISALRYD